MRTDPLEARRIKLFWLSLGLLLLFGTVYGLTQLLLEQTDMGAPSFSRNALLLALFSAVNFIAIIAFAFILGRNLIRLYFERRSGRLGSRFKTRLLVAFIGISLTPLLLLSFLAYGLINKSIERWFRAPAKEVYENAKAIADAYYQQEQDRVERAARAAASLLSPWRSVSAGGQELTFVQRIGRERGIDRIRIMVRSGREWRGLSEPAANPPPSRELLERAAGGEEVALLSRQGERIELLAVAPIFDRTGKVSALVLAEEALAPRVAAYAAEVENAFSTYQKLQLHRRIIRINYIAILALTTVLLIFAFAWFAMYIARRITGPIQALAEGAESVAAGNLDYRVECQAEDELAMLVDSFNRMTAELRRSNRELESRRRYMETVLENIATGVIALDKELRINTINRTAAKMLGLDRNRARGAKLEENLSESAWAEISRLLERPAPPGAERFETCKLQLKNLSGERTVAAGAAAIADAGGNKIFVIVLEDLTELIRAEKIAAWQEVAKRVAHEIKNPLTPIQLSAERLLKRFSALRSIEPPRARAELDAYAKTLEECVSIIISEAKSLKTLVDEFSKFARLPALSPIECDPRQVVEAALARYDGRLAGVSLLREYDEALPRVKLDPEQMKRALVNIIDNAIEATQGATARPEIRISVSLRPERHALEIAVADNGPGFKKHRPEELFLPYASTKGRGRGLGLAIVRQIVADHGGYVRAESNPPRGARVVIELPI